MVTLLGELMPGVHVVVKPYFPLIEEEEEEELKDSPSIRGQTMSVYDPNVDGQDSGDWRLWCEQFSQRGRTLGQEDVWTLPEWLGTGLPNLGLGTHACRCHARCFFRPET